MSQYVRAVDRTAHTLGFVGGLATGLGLAAALIGLVALAVPADAHTDHRHRHPRCPITRPAPDPVITLQPICNPRTGRCAL